MIFVYTNVHVTKKIPLYRKYKFEQHATVQNYPNENKYHFTKYNNENIIFLTGVKLFASIP